MFLFPLTLLNNMYYRACNSPVQPMLHLGVGKLVKADGIAAKVRKILIKRFLVLHKLVVLVP